VRLLPEFQRRDIRGLAAAYQPDLDEKALTAGQAIVAGRYTRANLMTIYDWKTNRRGRNRLLANTDEEIGDALRVASTVTMDRSAVAVLRGLYGVNVPVASAILTAMYPARYTVLDFRALEALGTNTSNRSLDFYLHYLASCRSIADKWGVGLRDLDRALWQWSKQRRE